MKILQAEKQHIDGILALLETYHKDRLSEEERKDGFVTASLSREKLEALFDEGNIATIAVEENAVRGVIMAGPWESWLAIPLFAQMARDLPKNTCRGAALTLENSYLYGPACLDRSIRGSGIFPQLFEASLAAMKDRYAYAIAFIDKSNGRSYNAHTKKTPLVVTGEFTFGENAYYYLACPTDARKEDICDDRL